MALTADQSNIVQYGNFPFTQTEELVEAAVYIYQYALVNLSAADGTSRYVKPAEDTASESPYGVALEACDNSSGAAGAKTVKVATTGTWKIPCSTASLAFLGYDFYATADDTIATSASNVTEKWGTAVAYESGYMVLKRY